MWETWVQLLGWEDPLEEEMATHSCIHDWEIPWTEEPGGLQSMGSQRVGHELATKTTSSSLFLSWHLDEPTLYMKRKGTRTFPVMWMEIKPQYCGAPFLLLRLAKDLSSMWRGCRETGKLVYSSVQFTCSLVSNSLRPHEPQHARLLCPSPTPRVYSNSCPLSQWCHPTNSSSVVPFSSRLQSFPASGSFQISQPLKSGGQSTGSFSFNISPFNEHPGLISFRIDWLELHEVQETLKSLLQHHNSKASILQCSAFFIVQLSHPYMTTGKTIALTRQTFVGKVTFTVS